MDWPKTLTLAVSIFALDGIVVLNANGIHASIDSIRADTAVFRAEAAADRRAMQATVDAFRAEAAADRKEFRQEMRALDERQARVEGVVSQLALTPETQ